MRRVSSRRDWLAVREARPCSSDSAADLLTCIASYSWPPTSNHGHHAHHRRHGNVPAPKWPASQHLADINRGDGVAARLPPSPATLLPLHSHRKPSGLRRLVPVRHCIGSPACLPVGLPCQPRPGHSKTGRCSLLRTRPASGFFTPMHPAAGLGRPSMQQAAAGAHAASGSAPGAVGRAGIDHGPHPRRPLPPSHLHLAFDSTMPSYGSIFVSHLCCSIANGGCVSRRPPCLTLRG